MTRRGLPRHVTPRGVMRTLGMALLLLAGSTFGLWLLAQVFRTN